MEEKNTTPAEEPKKNEMPEKPIKAGTKTPKFSMFMIIGALLVIFLCIVGLLIMYYFYQKDQNDAVGGDTQQSEDGDEEENPEEADNDNQIEEVETVPYMGTYVTADLPDGWIITEYEDGNGDYGLLSDGTYDGLTALTVTNPDGDVVFKIEAVNGIGGTGECSQVYQFPETEASYIQEQEDLAFGLNGVVPPTVDLSGQNYIEFELFGMEGRFLGNGVYWNVAAVGSNAFNPACNILQVALDESGLSFTYTASGQSSVVETYMPGVTSDFEYFDAEELGAILSSLNVI
ncbi:hypothetical protein JW978_03610 [Candidatus Dojkabacteria bacterium]|nr:hypothetical protein [Candidatus Dojkabacteria bacterium]